MWMKRQKKKCLKILVDLVCLAVLSIKLKAVRISHIAKRSLANYQIFSITVFGYVSKRCSIILRIF